MSQYCSAPLPYPLQSCTVCPQISLLRLAEIAQSNRTAQEWNRHLSLVPPSGVLSGMPGRKPSPTWLIRRRHVPRCQQRTCQQALLSSHMCSVNMYLEAERACTVCIPRGAAFLGQSLVDFLRTPLTSIFLITVNCSSPSSHCPGKALLKVIGPQAPSLCFLRL